MLFLLSAAWALSAHAASSQVLYPFESLVASDCGASVSVASQLRGRIEVMEAGRCHSVTLKSESEDPSKAVSSSWNVENQSLIEFQLADLFHLPKVSFTEVKRDSESETRDQVSQDELIFKEGTESYSLPTCGSEVKYQFRTVLRMIVMGSPYCSKLQVGPQNIQLKKTMMGYAAIVDVPETGSIPVLISSENGQYQDRLELKNDTSCEGPIRAQLLKQFTEKGLFKGQAFQLTAQFRKVSAEGNLVYWVKAPIGEFPFLQVVAQPNGCAIASIRLLKQAF